jgi:hypothetical protein
MEVFTVFDIVKGSRILDARQLSCNDHPNERSELMAYTCKNCGAVADAPGHLCNPCGDAQNCSFCGASQTDPKHICKDKLAAMKYVCEGCGRVAVEEHHLCKPSAIG